MCQLHRNHAFKEVMQNIWWKIYNGMEARELARKNTTVFYIIILFTAILWSFLNKVIMQIFGSHLKLTSDCIWCLHLCLGGKTKPAEICRSETHWNQLAHGQQSYQPQQSRLCLYKPHLPQEFLSLSREEQNHLQTQIASHNLYCTKEQVVWCGGLSGALLVG